MSEPAPLPAAESKMNALAPYGKALTGALIAALSAILTGLDDGAVDAQEIIVATIAFLTAGIAVWSIPYKPAP